MNREIVLLLQQKQDRYLLNQYDLLLFQLTITIVAGITGMKGGVKKIRGMRSVDVLLNRTLQKIKF